MLCKEIVNVKNAPLEIVKHLHVSCWDWPWILPVVLLLKELSLLAPQSGAHSRGAFRDFQPNPIHPVPLTAFEHLSLYIQKHLSVVTTNSKLEH